MTGKSTYEELEQRIKELESEIAQNKLREEALRRSAEHYRALFENNPVETIIVDPEGRVSAYNLARKQVGDRLPKIGDVMYQDYASKHKIDMHRELMECIKTGVSKEYSELKYKDKHLYIKMAPFDNGAIIVSRDMTTWKLAEAAREKLISELETALAKVKKLSGMLPICSSCKKIRDDKGYWNQIEEYIRAHSEADFSHGICPECARKLYPEVMEVG